MTQNTSPAAEVETTDDARATIGRAKTVHRASAWITRDEDGVVVSRKIFGTACGTDRRRGGRSVFSSAPQRWDVDCDRCLAQAAPAPAVDVAALKAEREQLLARLVEIDAQLAG